MFRHVVMFRWLVAANPEDRDAAVVALRRFGTEMADLGAVQVGTDAGLTEDNFDAVVIADFSDRESYLAYAADPRHIALSQHVLAPLVETRAAVQVEVD